MGWMAVPGVRRGVGDGKRVVIEPENPPDYHARHTDPFSIFTDPTLAAKKRGGGGISFSYLLFPPNMLIQV